MRGWNEELHEHGKRNSSIRIEYKKRFTINTVIKWDERKYPYTALHSLLKNTIISSEPGIFWNSKPLLVYFPLTPTPEYVLKLLHSMCIFILNILFLPCTNVFSFSEKNRTKSQLRYSYKQYSYKKICMVSTPNVPWKIEISWWFIYT